MVETRARNIGKLPGARPTDSLAAPMRRMRFKSVVCSLLAVALLIATSQYLTHFHIQPAHTVAVDVDNAMGHGGNEHCSLCLQFDRLPAPPAAQPTVPAYFFLIATLEAERLERLALETPQLWPPSRGPPALA
jgi:hypothetical protein